MADLTREVTAMPDRAGSVSAAAAPPTAACPPVRAVPPDVLATPAGAARPGAPATFASLADGPAGLAVTWTGDLAIERVLAAAHRHELHRAGLELPAWGEPGSDWASEGQPAAGPEGDPLGEDAARAALDGTGRVLPLGALAGHALMAPGPDLAGWLSCAQASELDDAALTTSITAWRKVTSWAQAHELAAVAELARRRGVAGAGGSAGQDADGRAQERDPVAELEAGFAPNEVALALTLTQGGAEYWMELAVSLSGRLPATLAALGEGKIDLNRAKLIDQHTSSLDPDLARAVERRVLVRAGRQTTGQLRASLQRAVLAVDPQAAERRREEAEKNAWVALFGDQDGTASLSGRFLPAAQAAAAWARICAMAKAMEAAGADGGVDLLRAQVFVGLLLGTLPLIPPADGAPGGEPHEGGPEGGSPDEGGPDGGEPHEDGPGGSGPHEDGPGGSGPHEGGPAGGSPDEGGPGGGSGTLTPDGTGSPVDGEPDSGGRDGDGQDDGRPALAGGQPFGLGGGTPPAWPPLPVPGAEPAPGCARLARAGLDGTPGRRGPPALAGRGVLSVPWRTLAGLCSEPGLLSRIGPVTADVARDLALAAAVDVTCEWRVIVVGRSGRALAVAKIRRMGAAGRPRGGNPALASLRETPGADVEPGVVGRITLTIPVGLLDLGGGPDSLAPACLGALGQILNAALKAGASALSGRPSGNGPGACTHEESTPAYRVPDLMRARVEARDQTCRFPTCRQPAWRCEQDHTISYRLGGPTCPCNLSPECARHHRLKHLPNWRLDQPRPGVLSWTTPAGLRHTVTADPYAF